MLCKVHALIRPGTIAVPDPAWNCSIDALHFAAQLGRYILNQHDGNASIRSLVVLRSFARHRCVDDFRRQVVHVAVQRINNEPADQSAEDNISTYVPAICVCGDLNCLGLKSVLGNLDGIGFLAPIAAVTLL